MLRAPCCANDLAHVTPECRGGYVDALLRHPLLRNALLRNKVEVDHEVMSD